jgi:tetratricopeptide (TPR) repeat protein
MRPSSRSAPLATALATAALLAVTVVPAVAAAQMSPNVSAARDHFRRGTAAFREGRHLEAAQEFEAAYRIVGDPILLFNIGQAYEKAGQISRAIVNYEAYVQRAKNAEDLGKVQAHIAELRQKKALAATQATVAQTSGSEPSGRPGPGLRIAGGVIGGVGVAALVAGIVIGSQAKSRADSLTEQSQQPGVSFGHVVGLQTQGQQLATAAYALYGVGSALTITGVVLFIVDARQRRRVSEAGLGLRPVVSPVISPSHAGLLARWRF